MKKFKDFSIHEKILIILLVVSIILVVFSWDRIYNKAKLVFNLYMGKPPVENTK